jgi:hypothetical protein
LVPYLLAEDVGKNDVPALPTHKKKNTEADKKAKAVGFSRDRTTWIHGYGSPNKVEEGLTGEREEWYLILSSLRTSVQTEVEHYSIAKEGQSIGSTVLRFGSSDGKEWTTEDWEDPFVTDVIGRLNWGTLQDPGPFRKYCLDATQVSLAGLDLSGVRVEAPSIRAEHLRNSPYHRNMILFEYQ